MQATPIESTITTQLPDRFEPKPLPPLRRWAEALGWSRPPGRVVDRLIGAVEEATGRDEVHTLLLRSAQELTAAARVEVRPVGGPNRVLLSRSAFGRAADDALRLPIRFRDEVLGTLLISPRPGRRITPAMIAHLETLCAIAAIGDRLLGRERHLRLAPAADPGPGPSPNALLLPFLRQLILLARRRREPLGVLAIGLSGAADGEPGGPGPEVAAVMGTLRESDLVVRNDERTLIAVLPNASAANAAVIAESVARAILEASGWSELGRLAIGAACYPEDAREADVLLDVAIEALRRSRDEGLGQVVVADRDAFVPRISDDARAGMAG